MKVPATPERRGPPQGEAADIESAVHAQNVAELARACRALAHSLNNMLTVSHGNLMLLERMLRDADAAADAAAVGAQLRGGLQRVETLAGNLLLLARADRFRAQPVNLRNFFSGNCVQSLQALPATACTLEIDAQAADIRTDPAYLAMALNAVVANAREALAPGAPLQLRCEARTGRDRTTAIAVSDNGGGIPDDIRAHVFDAGFTTKSGGHAGIGLWFVRQVMLASGGTARVESAPQAGGARIVLHFPDTR